MKLSLSIPALVAGAIVSGTVMAIEQSPVFAQDASNDSNPEVEEICGEDFCVQIERTETRTPNPEPNFGEGQPQFYPPYPVYPPFPVLYPEPVEASDRPQVDPPYAVEEPQIHSGGDYFFCGADADGVPTTFVSSEGEALPLIRWVSHYFSGSGYNPKNRCEQVSDRFSQFYQAGVLNYITTGYVNRLPVVCVSSEIGGPCTDVLFTLKPGEDATRTIQQLFDVRVGQAGPLHESGSRVYINLDEHVSDLASR